MNENVLNNLLAYGTAAMVFIFLAIVTFVIIYQRKMFTKQQELSQVETENQKKLVDAVLTTKEIEQKRIAQELHDEIGSSLNALKMSLIRMEIDTKIKEKLEDDLIDISKNVRRISNDLMPSVLDELGFHQALNHLIKKYQESNHVIFEIVSSINAPFPLEKKVELSLYRVLQELITNILKYSNAGSVILNLKHNSSCLEITLIDDGDGFIPDEKTISKNESLGLKNIISRLQQIKAVQNYSFNIPKGTKVTISLMKP